MNTKHKIYIVDILHCGAVCLRALTSRSPTWDAEIPPTSKYRLPSTPTHPTAFHPLSNKNFSNAPAPHIHSHIPVRHF